MTRDAEHTPSPQSVVVPVEPTQEMIDAGLKVDWSNEDERGTVINVWYAMNAARRHEAPADHHEQNLTASNAELIEQALSHPPLEAPAEGAGEREEIARSMDPKGWGTRDRQYEAIKRSTMHDKDRPLAFANADYYTRDSLTKADAIIALRARSSAPEARS